MKLRIRPLMVGLVVGLTVFWLSGPVSAQEYRSEIRQIEPRSVTVGFDRLLVRYDEEDGLVIDYAIERESWRRLQKHGIDAWLEINVPMEVSYRFWAFNYFRAIWPVSERATTLQFPDWVAVNRYESVGICLLGAGPNDSVRTGSGFVCDSVSWFRPRSNWSVQLSAGTTMRLRRQEEPLRLIHLYWVAPIGPFFIPGTGWEYPLFGIPLRGDD